MHEIQLDYITQFWEAYPENRKAFRTRFLDAHEVTGENIKYNDKDFVKFFEDFKDKGYLYNTIIYFIADHGQHFVVGHVPFLPDDSRYEENYLPLFIALVPADIPSENLRFLKQNQHHFTTPIDVYSSLKSVAVGKRAISDKEKSYSILYETLPTNRDWDINAETHFDNWWWSNDSSRTLSKIKGKGLFYFQIF